MDITRNRVLDITRKIVTPGKRTAPTRRGNSMGEKAKDMNLPGNDYLQHIIPGNRPLFPGIYLVFYQYDPPLAFSNVAPSAGKGIGHFSGEEWDTIRTASMTVANYHKDAWSIGASVLAYMGPLPMLNLELLKKISPGYPMNQTFYIATMKQASMEKYESGPHAEYILAFLQPGYPDEFIFMKESENEELEPISKHDANSKAPVQWQKLTKEQKKKYSKYLESLK